ncbi:MAG TPA: AMP-binding protein [Anaeromyxobacter sp.]|nr:AMP-binding protein [Anaeromyxobacter sp.]
MSTIAIHGPGAKVAVGERGCRTAADLEADALRVRALLSASPPGEVVLICADRYHFAAALLGAWAAGHRVRLPPNGQPEAVRSAAAGAEVRALLHDREDAPDGVFLPELLAGSPVGGELRLPSLDGRLVVMTTSGSTGQHQSHFKTGTQLVSEGELIGKMFAIGPGARVLATVPPHHIYGLLWGVLMPLRSGAAMVREGPLHAEAIAAELERWEVTHLVSVPAHLAPLALVDRARPLAAVFSAGAPLPFSAAQALSQRHGWRVIEVYGSTETGGVGWRNPGEEWTPFPDATVGADEEGRLLVDSPRLDPEAPRPCPVPDRVELREGGRFELLGRVDGVVKVAGKRVSLKEVEERLLAVPGVRDAAALAEPSPGLRGEEIWVAVAAAGQTPERLREALAGWLDPVALPRRIRVLEALPREATGKLSREKLRALFEAPPARTRLDPEAEETAEAPAGRQARRLTFTVWPDLVWFRGHFPELPVLPGVVQLDGLVMRQVDRIWPGAGTLRAVKRLKFSRLIRPGEKIVLWLEHDPARAMVAFAIDGPQGRCASGTLALQGRGS